ncbi:SMI1/KNR4 family protein [Paludisphaera mucosa]|uniref:SMI1/KNR4 family protein n=1 Tax=Paludisphaera mucosa TaxID=3030827 RepID=A0ABT6F7Z8_9BACT|nr:SMI1/KNR4 family protein [Paludisphaera mucosa]MDG3003717.1 SMI1/KNR4 family protein [Paludisphaera mucosa]
MPSQLQELVDCWMAWGGVDLAHRPDPRALAADFGPAAVRPGASPGAIAGWENRHGFRLPPGLRSWLLLSDGLHRVAPLIHPISAIGPMILFGRMDDLHIQPESWFELGNPNVETICIDLAYRWPGGGCPIFVSGDDEAGTKPRIVARSFEEWFLTLLNHGGREYWLESDFESFGTPWEAHRRFAPQPELPDPLRPFAAEVGPLVLAGLDEREIAARTGLTHDDIEAIVRYLQHVPPNLASP